MRKVKTFEFTSATDHAKWISENGTTGLKEVGCDVVDGIIKIEYIELY